MSPVTPSSTHACGPSLPRIVVSDPLAPECRTFLERQPDVELDYAPALPPAELAARLAGARGLIVRSGTRVTAELLAAAGELVAIGRAGTGVDNIDVEAATRRGVVVMNAPGGNTIAAAEHTLALLLALARHVPPAWQSLCAGEWRRSRWLGFELHGKTLGVIGFGRIGRAVARRALAFGMRVMACDPYVTIAGGSGSDSDGGVEEVTLETLLAGADIITLHLPLVGSTRHLLGDAAFAAMRPGVRVVNAARGGLIDEQALLRAIEAGRVAGAALDVFEREPPGDHPLLRRPEVIATPHLGALTREAQVQVAMTVAQSVLAVLRGEPARDAVNRPAAAHGDAQEA